MAKIDNGAGDHLIILFSPDGSIIKGFDHESELSPYGVKTANWHKGKVEIPKGVSDGSDFLVGCIFHTPEDFVEFVIGYFELSPSLDVVAKIYDDFPITEEMINILNSNCDVQEVLQELELLNFRG
ncbi:hypothetical protein [Paenibacillus phytohabitans]|uniref:hypothetical protein n=1 Tax=Paenibacillus phytohabitans TaxID=2654978 RepID=UPI0030089B3F